MNIKIYPSKLSGCVFVPSSKSLTHRYLICAALSKGKSVIEKPLISDDTLATITVLRNLGAKIKIKKDKIIVRGIRKPKKKPISITILESATTLRVLLPILVLFSKHVTINSSKRLIDRIYTNDIFALKGLDFQRKNITLTVSGNFSEKEITLSGKITSQLISGMLIALPFLGSDYTLKIIDTTFKNPYIALTLDAMKKFGIDFVIEGNTIKIKEGSKYLKQNVTVEGDFSNGAVWLAASYLHKDIEVCNLNLDSLQGDKEIITYFKMMGVDFTYANYTFKYKQGKLTGNTFNIEETPDLAPILVAIASVASSNVIISGTEKLAYKESNRKLAIMEVVNSLGGCVKVKDDEIIIEGKEELKGGVIVNSYNDHRIVMATAILATISKNPVVIKNVEAVNKSYPNFFNDLASLGCKFEVVE